MKVEIEDIREFLAAQEPYRQVPQDVVTDLAGCVTIRYVRRGETIVSPGERNDTLFIIRSGAIDIADSEDVLLDRREAGRTFGYSTLVGSEPLSKYAMVAVEDSLLYCITRKEFNRFAATNPDLARYWSGQSARINAAANALRQDLAGDALRTLISEVMVHTPVTVAKKATIRDAAQVMAVKKVSSVLVMDGDLVAGIVTERDFTRKVIAGGIDAQGPVTLVMTPSPVTVTPDTPSFEAMLLMAERRVHHLPVVASGGGALKGLVTTADIMRLIRNDPIYVTADMENKRTPEQLSLVHDHARDVAVRFITRGASAGEVSALITVAADGIARRLCALAEEKLGAPPVPYSFVAIGSQGRKEMGLASDQDNGIVFDDSYDEKAHGQYFAEFSHFVNQGLCTAGQSLCPGDMMAMNPQWRMTVTKWLDTFRSWIGAPEPDALLHTQTFFDFRGIAGEITLADQVHAQAVILAKGASRTHAHLAGLAARREPPLGFFRGFVVDRSGQYENTLDVKKGGTAAIVQMARLFALSAGVTAIGTRDRLRDAAEQGALSEQGASDLLDAFDFLSSIALSQQAAQVRAGATEPDYHINPDHLRRADKEHLRDAFQVIKSMQTALASMYPVRSL